MTFIESVVFSNLFLHHYKSSLARLAVIACPAPFPVLFIYLMPYSLMLYPHTLLHLSSRVSGREIVTVSLTGKHCMQTWHQSLFSVSSYSFSKTTWLLHLYSRYIYIWTEVSEPLFNQFIWKHIMECIQKLLWCFYLNDLTIVQYLQLFNDYCTWS